MIAQVKHGSDFGGLFRYLLASDKGAKIIGGNVAGRTPGELTQEFNNCADQRRTTKKPVKHLIIGFATSDGYVANEVKARIAQKAVEQLGYTYNQYLVVDHHRSDPGHDWNHDHDHIHIAVNMITLDGKRVDDWQDKCKLEKILRQLEKEEQLTVVPPSSARKFKALSHGQTQRIKRELKEIKQGKRKELSEIPLMVRLQAAIERASVDQPDLTTFIARLQNWDIDVQASISDKGRKRISYKIGSLKVRGSKLHNGSFPKLISKRGIDFNLNRDRQAMEAASSGKPVIIPPMKLIEWKKINLAAYLPDGLKEDYKLPQMPVDFNNQKSNNNLSREETILTSKYPQQNQEEVPENLQEVEGLEYIQDVLNICKNIIEHNRNCVFINQKISEFPIAKKHSYLESLGIEINTLNSECFTGSILVDRENNAIFPHQDLHGYTGFEGINYQFNRFSKRGTKSLWQSNFKQDDLNLIIVETPIEALSYHQLHNQPKNRYIAVENNNISSQLDSIIQITSNFTRQGGKVIIATDNEQLKSQLFKQIHPYCIKYNKSKNQTWNQDLQEKLQIGNFAPKLNKQQEESINIFEELFDTESHSTNVSYEKTQEYEL